MDKPRTMAELGWRLGEEYAQSKQQDYVNRMVEEQKAIPRAKIPPSTVQCASTQAILDRPVSEDEAWHNRPLPTQLEAGLEIIERDIAPDEYDSHKRMQRATKNTLGQSEESAFSEEKKEKAAQGFTYSKPADLSKEDMARVISMIGYESAPIPHVEPKKPKKEFKFSGLLSYIFPSDIVSFEGEGKQIVGRKGWFE